MADRKAEQAAQKAARKLRIAEQQTQARRERAGGRWQGGPGPLTGCPRSEPGIPALYPATGGYSCDLPVTDGQTLPIFIGSVCSGMMTEHWACEKLPRVIKKAFWCEQEVDARKFIQDNIEPGVPSWRDVMTEEFLTGAPPCDILLAGFPCQPFSIMGKGEGENDSANRGVVVWWILRYVAKRLPKIVLLENVAGLVFRHRHVLDNVVAILESLGYVVSWRMLNTKKHGAIPARRKRVFIVAIRSGMPAWTSLQADCQPQAVILPQAEPQAAGRPAAISWPQPVPCPGLDIIFDDTPKVVDYNNYPMPPRLCLTRRKNLLEALRRIKQVAMRENADPAEYRVVADLAGSKVLLGWDVAPCLTKTAGERHSFFSIQHGRFLSVRELCRLQGLNADSMKINISARGMGKLLGNGFTSAVIERVMAAAICAAEDCPATGGNLPPATGGGGLKLGYDTPLAGQVVLPGHRWQPTPSHRRRRIATGI